MSGVFSPTRAKIKERTLRTDKWWLEPAITFGVLFSFIIYATFRAFEGANYYKDHLISPFYSPCLSEACVPEATIFGWTPVSAEVFNFALSPALIILIFPLGFRMTCYYYRKAYYRAFWLSPPACAVAEPHTKYTGETRAPLILQNAHRWFFYAGLVFNMFLTYDAIISFKSVEGEWGHMSVGSLVLVLSSTLLWFYSLSCHTCRHTVGGRLKHFSAHPIRYKLMELGFSSQSQTSAICLVLTCRSCFCRYLRSPSCNWRLDQFLLLLRDANRYDYRKNRTRAL
jgi:hypothetical protein